VADEHRPDDPLPAIRAELDQLIAMSPEIARVARGIFDSFSDEGFDGSQALYLTAVQLQGKPGTPP